MLMVSSSRTAEKSAVARSLPDSTRGARANRAKASYLNHAARPIASHPKVKNFRNCGMIWAFEVETTDPAFAGTFFQAALKQKLSLRPLGNTVYFMPPYTIEQPEMDLLVAGTMRALESC